MAKACAVVAYKQRAWAVGWHIRDETCAELLPHIVDAQQAQPLVEVFDAGHASSSDGQNFPLGWAAEGGAIPDELLPVLSPLAGQHINLTGDGIWSGIIVV